MKCCVYKKESLGAGERGQWLRKLANMRTRVFRSQHPCDKSRHSANTYNPSFEGFSALCTQACTSTYSFSMYIGLISTCTHINKINTKRTGKLSLLLMQGQLTQAGLRHF